MRYQQFAIDSKETPDNFEIWEVWGDLSGSQPSCFVQVASFIVSDVSRIYLWNHEAERISGVRPGIYKVEMSGRGSPFSGLEVDIELSNDRDPTLKALKSLSAGQPLAGCSVNRPAGTASRDLPSNTRCKGLLRDAGF